MQQTITTVLGDSRPASRYYEDGSFDCPYCWAAVISPATTCPNPGCESSPYWTPEKLAASRAKDEAKRIEEAQRKRNHEWAMERIQEDKRTRAAWREEQIEIAKVKGTCLRCLIDNYDRVKFIKHRGICPKSR